MKILIIYCLPNPFNKNRRIHYGFLEKLQEYCDTVILTTKLGEVGKNKKSLENAYKKHKPDIILAYDGVDGVSGSALSDIPCKKVSVDIDSIRQFKNNFSYHKRNKFDLSIQRGSFIFPNMPCPSVWLPFSADENIFKPLDKKDNIVGISATDANNIYKVRKKSVSLLKKSNLIKYKKVVGKDYVDFIRSVSIGLTTTETNNSDQGTPRAKMWEYMACKTVVLTTTFEGIDKIFPIDYNEYICVYREDCEDLINKTKMLINDNKYRQKLADNTYELFLKDHTDMKRAEELYNIINAVLKNKEIPRKWGR